MCVSKFTEFFGKKEATSQLGWRLLFYKSGLFSYQYSMLSSIRLHHDFRTSSDVYNKAIITSYRVGRHIYKKKSADSPGI